MEGQPTTAESKPQYRQSSPWSTASSPTSTPRVASAPQLESPPAQFATPLDFLPILLPQQSVLYQAQLLQYNKLISPGRGGGGGGPQTSPHIPTASPINGTATRSRSSSKVSNKDNSRSRPGVQNCHGNKPAKNQPQPANSAIITPPENETPQPKMAGKKTADRTPRPVHQLPSRPPQTTRSAPHGVPSDQPGLSSSVPSTPHQHARKFSFGSREPSPGETHNHSPRSAYSDTNSALPSLRPLPPRLGGCRFETAPVYFRRRMNYNIGADKLEKIDLDTIKSKLSEDDERKLTTDMRELYDRLQPTEAIEKNRHKLVQKLEKLFNDEWPGHDIRVHLFGSSGNLLCSDDSDVDICITTEWRELEGVCMIAELLAKHGMEKVVCVSSAKVPIVKIWDPELGLACDMNVNNTLALENTRMVRTYIQIDERVRPLAMIIKYWTRKRVVNDAAFGMTLSSYTWICMIIAFLQLRNPPILPALHQREEKLTNKEGLRSDFADDVDKLRGFGDANKDSLGTLLFQFFRFYAHEFDYDKYALSVRLGKLISKNEKKWHLTLNNRLCVEEPFNTARNLGNTADDTSFRGLHIELRRAFDLIAEGKLDECCEQYIFPKEEERIWQKPASVPRPAVLVRSSSQHNSNRGGRGGYRGGGGRQFHRNGGNNSRRASSSVVPYDTSVPFSQAGVQSSQMTPQEAQFLWYQAQQPQLTVHQDIFGTTLNALQAQENNLRFHLFTQQQAMQTQQALAVAQRMQNGASSQSTDRSRTNSFDNPPLTAPIRPEMQYVYPYPIQPSPYYQHPGFTTYPSSPSTTTSGTATEFRRSLHRSTVTSDSGLSTGSGSLRSQSQPASRTSLPLVSQANPGYPTPTQGPTSVPAFPPRQVNGVPAPSFMPDDRIPPVFIDDPSKPLSNSPPEDDGPRYVGFYINDVSSPARRPTNPINGVGNGVSSYGEASSGSQGRRRLSTDQLPQSILDRRMKRTSRSPSPLGHARAYSVGTNSAPLASSPFPQAPSKLGPSRPLVVNGTAMPTKSAPSTSVPSRQSSGHESMLPNESSYDNPLRINQLPGLGMPSAADQILGQPPQLFTEPSPPLADRPVVMHGAPSSAAQSPASQQPLLDSPSFNQRMAKFSTLNINATPYTYTNGENLNGLSRVPQNGRSRVISRQQQNGIAPLDLATGEFMVNQDLQHLSPVYENRTPSPTFMRKFEQPSVRNEKPTAGFGKSAVAKDLPSSLPPKPVTQKSNLSKTPPLNGSATKEGSISSPVTNSRTNVVARENGHGRGCRNEGEHPNGWQKPKSKKKAGVGDLKTAAAGYSQVEQLPKNDADRKGG